MVKWIKKRDWLVRSLKTFAQAFVAALIAGAGTMAQVKDFDSFKIAAYALLCSSIASALSAAWNIAKEHFSKEVKL